MVVTTTGLAFWVSSVGLAFCGICFFKAFKNMGGVNSGYKTGILLSTYYLATAFQHFLLALAGTFFVKNANLFFTIIFLNHFVLSLIAALGVYLVFYVIFPNISPWSSICVVLIMGFVLIILTSTGYSSPLVTSIYSIDWNFSKSVSTLLLYIALIAIGSPLLVFLKNFSSSRSNSVKRISLILSALQLLGVVNVIHLFGGYIYSFESVNYLFESLLAITGIIFLSIFLIVPLFRHRFNSRKKIA